MDYHFFIDLLLHTDDKLKELIDMFGIWTYVILFLIIFAETGLVVTPFLPGDSLLFAAGAFAAQGSFNLAAILGLLSLAAILGNTSNYYIGKKVGPAIFQRERIRFIKKEYLTKTQAFYDKHGGKAIVISRFMPIFRTFVPFVAGIGQMDWKKFQLYNVGGGLGWIFSMTIAGFLLGRNPWVQEHFESVIYGIIIVSLLPAIYSFLRNIFSKKKTV